MGIGHAVQVYVAVSWPGAMSRYLRCWSTGQLHGARRQPDQGWSAQTASEQAVSDRFVLLVSRVMNVC
jgi:hypothetical protein